MDKIKTTKGCLSSDERLCIYTEDDFGHKHDIVPIDQSFGLVSNIDPATGFPFTDIQLVMRATNLADRNNLMENLQSFKPDFIDDSIPDEQAVGDVLPKDCQMPSEVLEHQFDKLEGEIREHNSEVEAAQKQELFDKFMEGNTSEVESKSE